MSQKLGIIQSRGLGDLVIALPIARWYADQGREIYWPIESSFVADMQAAAPWVNWLAVPYDPTGRYFYDVPVQMLADLGIRDILPLYQHLTGHPFAEEKYFQYTSFDQYKYIRAQVPFLHKWRLRDCIRRNPVREQTLYDLVVENPQYVALHLEGSDVTLDFDRSIIPNDWQQLEIKPIPGYTIWDWLSVLERAESIVCIDSVYANMVDQLGIGSDRYFIARSHIGLTPVQGYEWTWI